MTKYVRIDGRGNYKYRRRVPQELQPVLGKKEFVKSLGASEAEAMQNYSAYHAHVERLLSSSTPVSELSEKLEIAASLEAQFAEVQADSFSSGRSESERMARQEEVDRILQLYPMDPETGYPAQDRLTLKDTMTIQALQSGTRAVAPEPTIKNAFDLYLAEKDEPDPVKRKSQVNRVRRIERELLNILGKDLPISCVTREHARDFRDHLKAQKTSTSTHGSWL